MPLPPGTRVGIYEVVELIGVGGMGEVYRARDPRLDRPVAIKTLPVEFAADPDRLARFEREAKTLAQLNHPHIASIYGLETGTPIALAMEMAEGETLAHRIASGPIALDDALIIARQIAEGLEHAHAKGIVHRDLKPANVKIGPRDSDPHVKILDFGLAKAMSIDASPIIGVSSPTITSPVNLTRAGVVLGTAAYMAPEQARGRFVDHRADIWAFGCVLFEMLTGRRAFDGEEVADVMAKVIQSEPNWSLLPAGTPTNLVALLTRCLRKDQRQRFHSIADVRIELEEIANGAPADSASRAAPRRRSMGAALVGLVTGAAITAGLLLSLLPRPGAAPPQRSLRFSVACPPGYSSYRRFNDRLSIALSPDGEKLAAVMVSPTGDRSIFVRRLDELEFREIAGTEGATTVFWAADSTRLLFGTTTVLRQADLSGGGSRSMVNLAGFSAASWSADDQILAATSGGPLFQWPANGSQPVSAGPLTETVTARMLPQWLPNGEFAFLDTIGERNWILKRQKGTDQPREVLRFESTGSDSAGFALQSGYLLVSSTEPNGRTVLTARRYDLDSGAVGDASVLVTDLNPSFSASSNGTLVFGENRSVREQFYWIDAHGNQAGEATPPAERPTNFDLSHDERFIAVQQAGGIVIHDIARGVTTPPLPVTGTDPIWSADDRQILYAEPASNAMRAIPAFGGSPRLIYQSKDAPIYPEDWSMDGQWIAAVTRNQGVLIPTSRPDTQPISITAPGDVTKHDELRFSPDGHWLAFGQSRAGVNEAMLTAVPPTGERWQLSFGGGAQPRWRSDGRALYFQSMTGTLMTVDVTLTPGKPPQISVPRRVFDTGIAAQPTLDQYTPTRDRNRFLMRRPLKGSKPMPEQLQVIVNWPTLLFDSRAKAGSQ